MGLSVTYALTISQTLSFSVRQTLAFANNLNAARAKPTDTQTPSYAAHHLFACDQLHVFCWSSSAL